MNAKKEVPVLLLTGYLGSGKTTLLNKILANEKGIKFAVIVNDIGEVNIDAALIEKGGVVGQKDDSLVSLQNGCICCTLKMDLVEQLKEIVDMKRFDYIVIEASGICEPAPIAQTICSIPSLGPQYIENGILRLDSIVTVVDALRMKDEFSNGSDLMKKNIDEEDLASLVIQQIEFCNIILLNKAAEVEPKDLEHLKQIIRAIQPKAEIFECNYGDVDLNLIVNTKKFDWETVATSAGWIQEIESERNEEHEEDDVEEAHEHHHHHHHDDHCGCGCEGHEHEHDHHHHDDYCGCGCEGHEHEHDHHHHHHDEHCGYGCEDHAHDHGHHHSHSAASAKRVYILENLGCAHCASKMEEQIQHLDGVENATITFATKQLRVTAADPDALLPQIRKICTSIESEVKVVPRNPKPSASADITTRIYLLENLGCAHCASKMEEQIADLDGISEATITFATRQLRVTAKNPDRYLDQIRRICTSIESEVIVKEKEPKPKAQAATSETHTASTKRTFSKEKIDTICIIIGAILFVAGEIMEHKGFSDTATLPVFVIAYLALGGVIVVKAAKNISHGQIFDENFLMSIATLAAFAINDSAEAVGVMLFYRIGELFEEKAVERSRGQIMDAVDLRPEVVNLVAGDDVQVIPSED